MHLNILICIPTLAQDQYKYGDELIAQVYGANARILDRRASKWHNPDTNLCLCEKLNR